MNGRGLGILIGCIGLTIACKSADSAERARRERAVRLANSDDSVLTHEELGVEVIAVTGEVLSDTTAFGRLSTMVVAGERLWVADRQGSPFFHVLDTATGTLIRSIGKKGQGPGEFVDVVGMSVADHASSSIWAYDWREARLTLLEPTTLESSAPEAIRIVRLNVPPTSAGWHYGFGPRRFLEYTRDPAGGFRILDAEGGRIDSAPYRYPGDSAVPSRAWREAINGAGVCFRTDGDGFAMEYPNAGRIELYDRNARLVGRVRAPYPTEERFGPDAKTNSLAHVPHRVYYGGCAFSDSLLFATFSGRLHSARGAPRSDPQFVHVFDLDGKLLQVLALDRRLSMLAPNRSGTTLFGGSVGEAAVYRFRLPEIRKRE